MAKAKVVDKQKLYKVISSLKPCSTLEWRAAAGAYQGETGEDTLRSPTKLKVYWRAKMCKGSKPPTGGTQENMGFTLRCQELQRELASKYDGKAIGDDETEDENEEADSEQFDVTPEVYDVITADEDANISPQNAENLEFTSNMTSQKHNNSSQGKTKNVRNNPRSGAVGVLGHIANTISENQSNRIFTQMMNQQEKAHEKEIRAKENEIVKLGQEITKVETQMFNKIAELKKKLKRKAKVIKKQRSFIKRSGKEADFNSDESSDSSDSD